MRTSNQIKRRKANAGFAVLSGLDKLNSLVQDLKSKDGRWRGATARTIPGVVAELSEERSTGCTTNRKKRQLSLIEDKVETSQKRSRSLLEHPDSFEYTQPLEIESVTVASPSRESAFYLLPNELLLYIGEQLEVQDVLALTSVCRLFRDLFFCVFLRRCGFRPGQSFICLNSPGMFTAFRSFHRLQTLPTQAYLSAFISARTNVEVAVACITYTLTHLPPETFKRISVSFSPFNHEVSADSLKSLFTAISSSQCSEARFHTCSIRQEATGAYMPSMPIPTWPLASLALNVDLGNHLFQELVAVTSEYLQTFSLVHKASAASNSLSPVDPWVYFLNTMTFPQLISLKLGEKVPVRLALTFLSRHPKVCHLSIHPGDQCIIEEDVTEKFDIQHLATIAGPPAYISLILCSLLTRPSLTRLSLLVDHLPNEEIPSTVFQCLALCHRIDTLEIAFSYQGIATLSVPDRDFSFLNVGTFRIILNEMPLDDLQISDMDIMKSWMEWCDRIRTVKHLQLDQAAIENREGLFKMACDKFPMLAVSVRWGAKVLENPLAVALGGFDWC